MLGSTLVILNLKRRKLKKYIIRSLT